MSDVTAKKDTRRIALPVLTPDGRPWEEQPAWRHDFPVDVPQDNYVARRDFTKFMVLTSFAFFVGQVWIAVLSAWRGRRSGLIAQRIGAIGDMALGSAISFNFPSPTDACVLIRTAEGAIVAYGAKCTHLSCAVLPDIASGVLRCPCHHGLFDLASGRAIAGPPRRPLPRILIEERNGEIFAIGVEERTT